MCSSELPNVEVNQEEKVKEKDSIPTTEMMYIDIEPIHKSDSSWIYSFSDMSIEVEPKSKIGYYDGVDFTVYNFILKGNDTVGMYAGWHPTTPSIYSFALKDKSSYIDFTNTFLEKARNNNNHLIEKDYTVIKEEFIDDTVYILLGIPCIENYIILKQQQFGLVNL